MIAPPSSTVTNGHIFPDESLAKHIAHLYGDRPSHHAPAVHIAIIPDPMSPAHKVVKAIVRGRVYAVTYAEPFPSQEEAETLWREDRRAFRPYNESTGRYLA